MAASSTFTNLVKQIRNAIYGKDVREAIANAIEICYDSSSGDVALDAADRANQAAANANTISATIDGKLSDIDNGLMNLNNIVKVSDEEPVEDQNKIWVQRNDTTEYKIPTFAAYEELWSRFQNISAIYQNGHGGVESITKNNSYSNPQDPLEREFVIDYSDGTSSTIHIRDGETGPRGPRDIVTNVAIWYASGEVNGVFTGQPPVDGWQNTVPEIDPGKHLWIRTVLTYESGAESYIYSLSRMGVNGTGAVNSVAIGQNGTLLDQDVKLPIDSVPTANSGNLMTSGDIYIALQQVLLSPALSGTPTAPTAADGDNSQQIATTAFVSAALDAFPFSCKRLHVTMTSSPFVYQSADISENTYCLINGAGSTALAWSTSAGTLTITSSSLPSGGRSFDVVLVNTSLLS